MMDSSKEIIPPATIHLDDRAARELFSMLTPYIEVAGYTYKIFDRVFDGGADVIIKKHAK